jgi:hypothetical protein
MRFKTCHIACVICWVFSWLPICLFAQTEPQLHEEIFVHCDKDLYLTNEICWFKLYCVDALLHRPVSVSKLAYWELLDRADKPIGQLKIGLEDGFGDGSYKLPGNLNSGVYKIRCYTNWMKNFDAGFYFEKAITVINPHQFYDKDTVKKSRNYGINFYPEGGNLVNGIASVIAFKIAASDKKGINGYGYVLDDLNDTIQQIRALSIGIGKFEITPQRGRGYRAVILLPHAEKITADLPKADDNGYVMQVTDSSDGRLRVTVRAGGDRALSGPVYLFVHTRSGIKVVQENVFKNSRASFIIDRSRLGDGVSQVTIFDAERHPVCERLFFKYPGHSLKIRVFSDKETYGAREKVNVAVNTMEDSSAQAANLSMAVYKIDTLQSLDKMNIENYLWLSADLVEAVESPEAYFDPAGTDGGLAMDNLMLTEGWRKYGGGNVAGPGAPSFKFLPEYTGHIIMGRIYDSAAGMAVRNRGVFVSSPGRHTVFGAAESDSNGIVRFDMDDFHTNGELIVRPEKLQDTIYNIEIQSPFSDAYSKKPLGPFSFTPIDSGALAEYYKDIVVQQEYQGSQPGRFIMPVVDTTPFFGKADISYSLDDFVRFTTMEEVLREYVAQSTVRMRDGNFEVSIWDRRRGQTLLEPAPLVLLDGVPTEINRVMSYDPLKVKRLDIVTEAFYYENMAFGGILSFSTYTGDLPGFDLDPHTIVMDYGGLEPQRVFHSPAYDTKEELESRLPDFRRLLYWQPAVITDKQGNNAQSFFSSDSPGKYVVVVQGVAADGKIGYGVREFTVKGTK